ncbi:MAG TPA: hypothetical protein VHJ20_00060 [Polyangia bacterium]|nr:hypothetical protein [Polyangia bacterium]
MTVPPSLRTWLLVHAAFAAVIGAPLFVAPDALLHRLGWTAVDPVATRLVAAALLAIASLSFFQRHAGVEIYRAILSFNVVWSMAAAVGLFVGIGVGAPNAAWAVLCAEIVFAGVWIHHAIRFRQHDHAPADEPVEN